MVNAAELVRQHVPDEHFASAIGVVRSIGGRVLGDQARREAAVEVLMHDLHVPESIARLLVELGVLFTKTAGAEPPQGS